MPSKNLDSSELRGNLDCRRFLEEQTCVGYFIVDCSMKQGQYVAKLNGLNLHDAGAQAWHLEEHRRNVKYQKVQKVEFGCKSSLFRDLFKAVIKC